MRLQPCQGSQQPACLLAHALRQGGWVGVLHKKGQKKQAPVLTWRSYLCRYTAKRSGAQRRQGGQPGPHAAGHPIRPPFATRPA